MINLYKKIDTTIKSFKINRRCNEYNQNLTRIIIDKLDEARDEVFYEELVVFIYADINENQEVEFRKELESAAENSEDLKDYEITFISKKMIDNQILLVNEGRNSVGQDKIRLYKNNNKCAEIIKYEENGLLTTISAKDLQRLYRKYKYDGLFEQNLRYYRPNKKIDDKIRNSIHKNKKNFWYFNNGIIIGCNDFYIDGDNIKLWSFSVINGGQTTALIGDYYEGEDDFAIPCKIIKGEDYEFLAQVAEASNSQKAISDVDLKANAPEQIQLKKLLENKEIYLEIKRGKVGSVKGKDINRPKKYNNNWDRISNEKLGQLLLSFVFQEPGTARSNKKGIFASNQIYKKIFLNKELKNAEFIKSLIRLNNYIEDFENSKENDFGADTEENPIIRYGKLFILAVIGFIIKTERGLIDFNYINDDEMWENELQRGIPSNEIFADYKDDDFELILKSLFQKIISIIKDSHQRSDEPNSTYTNFLKTNLKYRKYILKRVRDVLFTNQLERKRFKEDYLKIFNI